MISGTILHYKIIEKLGEGGMGVVYKAQDTKLHRTVALKFLPSPFISDEEAHKRFMHEAQAASALDHPNIGTIYEINDNDETSFISMAFYGGKTLKQKIAEGKISVEEGLRIAIKIASGLKKAHSKNIIHRDIKPGNIIFAEDGELKIIDFGLAKLMDSSHITHTKSTLGTLAYMSPEQIRGLKVDHRTDIWSLGVVLYEMFAGKCPFQGKFDQAIMYKIINEDPEFITKMCSGVPLQVEKIINKALSKDPNNRFNSMDEMEEALQLTLNDYKNGEITSSFIHKLGRKQLKILKRLSFILLSLVAIIAYLWFNSNATSKPVSIAVLPLENISDDNNQEWFADGMTDALITNLAQISSLRIISMSSILKFKKTEKTASDIAKDLGVSYVIEGSVLKINEEIKITTRLIDVANDDYLWAQEYNRNFEDVLSLPGEVARSIVGQLKVKVTPYEENLLASKHKVNPQAYENYLKGNFYWFKLTPEALETSLKYYKLATEIDSQYAPAYSGIALINIAKAIMGYVPWKVVEKKAELDIANALKLDSTLAEVHYMLGIINQGKWNWKKSELEFKKAIKLSPNMAEARAYYSHLLFFLKHTKAGMKQMEWALELDPFNTLFKALYGMALMYAKRYDDVIKMLENVHHDPVALSTLRSAYHQKRMYKKALEIWRQSFELHKDYQAIESLNQGNRVGGYSMALQRVAEMMIERSKTRYVTPWQIATLYTRAGMKKEALDWFEKAFEAHDLTMPYLKCDPIFDDLRDDSQFQNLIKKMGLPL
jgi:serine/threonine protein kinase